VIIYFLRHASAGQSKANPTQDAKRPLDKDGIDQCGYIGRALAGLDVQVDVIISSPLKRATQTASLVANEIGHDGKVVFSPALAPSSTIEDFNGLLESHARQDAIMLVGHNPNLSQFLSALVSGGANETGIDLKKGAVARIEWTRRKPAVLTWCVTPKLVRTIYDNATVSSRPKTLRK
jgi:phosphohistidine phosphatase